MFDGARLMTSRSLSVALPSTSLWCLVRQLLDSGGVRALQVGRPGTCRASAHSVRNFVSVAHVSTPTQPFLQQPVFPERSAKTPIFDQPLVEVLVPGPAAASTASPSHKPLPKTSFNAELSCFLRSVSLQEWEGALQKQCLTLVHIVSLNLADLVAAAPTLPSGVLVTIQRCAKEWIARDVKASACALLY